MDNQTAKELDEAAMNIVNKLIFKLARTNIERIYLTEKIKEFTKEKERLI